MSNSVALEEVILGSILIDKNLFAQWVGIILEKDFISPKNRKIWQLMTSQHEHRRPIDLITIFEQLGSRDMSYLTACVEKVEAIENFGEYIRLLNKRNFRLAIIDIQKEIKFKGLDPYAAADKIIALPRYKEVIDRSFQKILEDTRKLATSHKGTAFEFNLPALQQIVGGLDRGELLLIGAYTSFGKTSLGIHLSLGFTEKHRVLLCTSEMSEEEIVRRQLANLCQIKIGKFRGGYLTTEDNEKIQKEIVKMRKWNYNIIRVSLVSDIERAITKFNPDIVIVDHLQHLTSSQRGMKRYEIVTDNISRLQTIESQQKLGMIVLSQLHRPKDGGKLKRPTNADFRASGEIEEKATISFLLWWDAKVKNTVDRLSGDAEEFEINIAKNRDGVCGVKKFDWWPEYSLFETFTEEKNYET